MERFKISTKFVRYNGDLICNHDIYPQTICVHDPEIMVRLLYPVDYGFQNQGIVCEDWVTEYDVRAFARVLTSIYSMYQRKNSPERYRKDKYIIDGSALMSLILMCDMLGLPTEFDISHDGTECEKRLAEISLQKGVIVPYLYSGLFIIHNIEMLIGVDVLQQNPAYLIGLFCLKKDQPDKDIQVPITTLLLVVLGWDILQICMDEKSTRYRGYLIEEFKQLILTNQYNTVTYIASWIQDIMQQMAQLSGLQIQIPTYNLCPPIEILNQALFWNFKESYMLDPVFVRTQTDLYYQDSSVFQMQFPTWEISSRIISAFIKYPRMCECKDHIWPTNVIERIQKNLDQKSLIPDKALEFSNINTYPILLLLVGIITNDNRKFISEEEFRKVYGQSDNYSNIEEFIRWEKSLLQKFLDELPDYIRSRNKRNTNIIKQVMNQM